MTDGKEFVAMTEGEVREWFGNRGYPLNDEVSLTYKVVNKNGKKWLFILDNCHDYEGYDEVESYFLDTGFCEPYDGWPVRGFDWSAERLLSLVEPRGPSSLLANPNPTA